MIKDGKLYYDDKPTVEVKIGKNAYIAETYEVFYVKEIAEITILNRADSVKDGFSILALEVKKYYEDCMTHKLTSKKLSLKRIDKNLDVKVFASKERALRESCLDKGVF
jgi:hypothetical protein